MSEYQKRRIKISLLAGLLCGMGHAIAWPGTALWALAYVKATPEQIAMYPWAYVGGIALLAFGISYAVIVFLVTPPGQREGVA